MRTNVEEAGESPKHRMVDVMVAMFHVDPSLSGKELSERLGLSVSRLARVFKREVGVSIVEYRNRLRFQRFFALLTEGERRPTLRQAARAAGFGSYAHFHRLFRARWRTGPREGFRNGIEALAASLPAGTRVREIVVEGETLTAPEETRLWLERGDRRIAARMQRTTTLPDEE